MSTLMSAFITERVASCLLQPGIFGPASPAATRWQLGTVTVPDFTPSLMVEQALSQEAQRKLDASTDYGTSVTVHYL